MIKLRILFQWIIHLLWIGKGLQVLIPESKSIDIKRASYQVTVELAGNVQCGGCIVNHKWIITAASCLYNVSDASKNLRIRAGTSRKLYKGSFYWVSKVVIHPQFSGRLNDIALIELAVSLKYKSSIQPITLASRPPRQNSEGRITGWGTSNSVITNDTQHFSTLLQAHVTITNNVTCNELYGANLICVKDEPTLSPCDLGGPLVVGKATRRYNNTMPQATS